MIREAGDSALLLELEPRIDPAVNARAVAIAKRVTGDAIPGVRDVVSTYRSVAVSFDPLHTRYEAVAEALERGAASLAPAGSPRLVEVPVVYGGEWGPDLAGVASASGLDEPEVIRRHSAPTYRVFMLGFVPGFAYLGTVDESIAVPRRSTPRLRVPAGSVAIAGRQTGVYPQESPGGWQIVGRTRVRPFDLERSPRFLVEPGDEVRFRPVAAIDDTGPPAAPLRQPPRLERGGIAVLRPGLLTTIQDAGRWGHQNEGVSVAGPMDLVAHRLANRAAGNDGSAATIEITLLGPELRFDQDAVVALAGADLSATLDGAPMDLGAPVRIAAGATLRFGPRRTGARAYLAVRGGIRVPLVLGSRATHVLSAMGGAAGRPLIAGDRLPVGAGGDAVEPRRVTSLPPPPRAGARLRVLPGPQDDFFDASALQRLQQTRFVVSPQSDRMAYRLSGGSIGRGSAREMISDATFHGGIQVPPSGEPILLMADRQTTGGYPQIATVIAADLPLAGQLAPGDWIEFHVCSKREALAALIEQEGRLLAFR